MYTATLLTSPEKPLLDTVLVENLRSAWGGGDIKWLSVNEAAEFSLAAIPDNFWDNWSTLQAMGVDLAIQLAADRKKKMILADMDSTMIQQECIDELADEAGVGVKVADITARAMNGELEFDAALRERVGMLTGLEISVIDTVISNRITLMPGAKTLVATMKAQDNYAALVSGGFTAFTGYISKVLGFDEHRANTFLMADGYLTGQVADPILGRDAKVTALNEISTRLGITVDQVIAVGDGANDLGMLQLAGAGVALHAKPSVAAKCDIRINHGDLTALLYLQGYSCDEFIN
ncbi:MAG: phosphoserine phosphatase SerB [Paracoccaceae bacterium]